MDYDDDYADVTAGYPVVSGTTSAPSDSQDLHKLTQPYFSAAFHPRQGASTRHMDDIVTLIFIIASLVAAMSLVFVLIGIWRSNSQRRKLHKIVEMDSTDFLLYAKIAQNETSWTPCQTSLPCQMPYIERRGVRSSYPTIVPGYVRIVQVTHLAHGSRQKEDTYSCLVADKSSGVNDLKVCRSPPCGGTEQNLPKSTTSSPAILSGLWKQRHLLTGTKHGLVDSFTGLRRKPEQRMVRASHSDTSPLIDRSDGQSVHVACENCGSDSLLLGGSFPRNIKCRLCRERVGIRDVGALPEANTADGRNWHETTETAASPVKLNQSPGRPKLSTYPNRRRICCTAEVRTQLDPFRTMVLASSSSDTDSDSDSD